MDKRLKLHEELCAILGSRNVYFQPPENIRMEYPAIKYSLQDNRNTHADNRVYFQSRLYDITVIDRNPDSEIMKRISQMRGARFDRSYTSDNLNHWVFTLNY